MRLRQAWSAAFVQQRQQRAQRLRRVADQVHLHRIAQAQHFRRDVDLHRARLALLGQEFRIGKARADHQQRVALGHQIVARLGAEQADRAGDPGQIVGQRRLAEQRLGDAGAEPVGDRDDLVGGLQRAGADEDRDLLAGVEHLGGLAQLPLVRDDLRRLVADARMQRAVRTRRLLVFEVLQIVGEDHRGHPALGDRDAHRAVGQMAHLRRHRRGVDEGAGDVLEHRRQIDLLLVMAAERHPRLLAGDRQHRHVIEPRVVKPGDEMRRARPRGGDADAELAGELGMRRGHEGGHLLVPDLDELDLAFGALQRAEHAVDAVAGIAVDPSHAPLMKTLDKEVADGLGHGFPSLPREFDREARRNHWPRCSVQRCVG